MCSNIWTVLLILGNRFWLDVISGHPLKAVDFSGWRELICCPKGYLWGAAEPVRNGIRFTGDESDVVGKGGDFLYMIGSNVIMSLR